MLQLKNNTPFESSLAIFPNQHGIDTLYIIVKATFNIGQQWTLADEQKPPQGEDEYWGDDPATSSIKNASDIHIGKPATDIIMTGLACAHEKRKVSQMDVSLSVGHVNKAIRVFGDRQWINGAISTAKPFSSMPLIYEKAFGGIHQNDGKIVAGEDRNPVGCGFSGKRKAKEMDGQPVPNLEDPRQLLQKAGDIVTPAGFGFISPNWQTRLSYAGTYDENWQKTQAPYLPKDFDLRFFNMAHPELIYPGFLAGGEPVHIKGVHPGGGLQFNVPVVALTADVAIKSRNEQPAFNLETLLIETDPLQLGMTFRAALPCDKETLKIREVVINLSRKQSNQAA
ncbi:MAG: DUF2169 family type VI secretion system accessory protein [Gammaproteobacteria bacterium]